MADANVLINFLHLERLDVLGNLPGHTFSAPDHVVEEISDPGQRERLEAAVGSGFLGTFAITDLGEIESLARFRRILGQIESGALGKRITGSATGELIPQLASFPHYLSSKLRDRIK